MVLVQRPRALPIADRGLNRFGGRTSCLRRTRLPGRLVRCALPAKGYVSSPRERSAQQAGRRLHGEARFGNKPNGAKVRCCKQIQGFRRKQTQVNHLPCNQCVTAGNSPIFRKFKCGTSSRVAGIAGIFCAVYGLRAKIFKYPPRFDQGFGRTTGTEGVFSILPSPPTVHPSSRIGVDWINDG